MTPLRNKLHASSVMECQIELKTLFCFKIEKAVIGLWKDNFFCKTQSLRYFLIFHLYGGQVVTLKMSKNIRDFWGAVSAKPLMKKMHQAVFYSFDSVWEKNIDSLL